MPPSLPILPLLLLLLLCFLLGSDKIQADTELDILLDLKSSLGIENSTTAFDSWSPSSTPCRFSGISCHPHGSVEKIDLSSRGISGTIPFASLCNLPSLVNVSLSDNKLAGTITADIANCTRLRSLDLSFNKFTGNIPDLSPLSNLQALKLNQNLFTGVFPWSSLSNLTGLVYLSLGDNLLFDKSPFPETVANLSNLSLLYLSDCNLRGEIPSSIGNLTKLVDLEFADNFLSGEIPKEITKLTKLWQLEIYNNSLTGKLPDGFGNLTELAYFDASMNNLEGDLSELRFLSKLISLQLFYNGFSGEIPAEFGDFKFLVNLSLYNNRLTGNLPAKLGSWSEFNFIDVSTNFLTGRIPPDMCKMRTMLKLLLLENQLTGEIPGSYANCTSLIRFRVSNNSLSGAVPAGLWALPKLDIMDLAINQLEGPIDARIGKAKSLSQLLVADNKLSGVIPAEISAASSLVNVDLASNSFSGPIPASIGGLKKLSRLALEQNSLTGEIPDSLGSCVALSAVNLADNSLAGEIPASIGQLPSLNSLILANNKLHGEIPASLASLKLSSLDLSNNQLAGEIPAALSISAYNNSYVGNPSLCSNSIVYLKQCSPTSTRSSTKLTTTLMCLLVGFVLICSLALFLYFKRQRSDVDSRVMFKDSWDLKSFRILTFDEQEIVNSIAAENLIGKGGSGNVYRVSLGSGKVVAVKHIWHHSPDTDAALFKGASAFSFYSPSLTRCCFPPQPRLPSISRPKFPANSSQLKTIQIHISHLEPTPTRSPPIRCSASSMAADSAATTRIKKNLMVFDSEDDLAAALAKYTADLSSKFSAERGAFTVVISGGSLVKSLRKLVEVPYVDSIEWGKWHVFWVDERVVPKDHEDSNYKLAYDGFLSKVPIPPGHVYAINDALPAEGAADDYETCLKQLVKTGVLQSAATGFPKFDLMLLGMGPDGHVASLFPGHPLLNEHERWITFIKDSPKPPPGRITFTFPVINSSANIVLVATGSGKAGVLRQALGGDAASSEVLPVQMIAVEDGELTWFADKAAASKL